MLIVRVAETPEEADAFVAHLADNGVAAMTQADFKASADLPSAFDLADRCTVLVSSEEQAELVRRVVAGETSPLPAPRPHSVRPIDRRTIEIMGVGLVVAGAFVCGGWGLFGSMERHPALIGGAAICAIALAIRLRRPVLDAFFGRSPPSGDEDT